MSYISGNTFFIENSINCSNLETINGQVNFIDCSQNCGAVSNAIFSGSYVINCGQTCGCTIFCDSVSFGCICGTGILRGNSSIYGSADCIIQCDQSYIHNGASVANVDFLVTTSRPVNPYSNDGCYYIYLSGACTLGNGAWSNYYFCSGSPCEFVTSVCDVQIKLAANVQDATGDWRTYSLNGNNYLIQTADGDYFNLSVCNCILYTGTSCFPVCVNGSDNIEDFYTTYISGSGYNILSGLYLLGHQLSGFGCFNNDIPFVGENIIDYDLFLDSRIITGQVEYGRNLVQNSNLIYGKNLYANIVYPNFWYIDIQIPTDFYPEFFSYDKLKPTEYSIGRKTCVCPGYWNGFQTCVIAVGRLYEVDLDYCSNTPHQAQDDNKYYIYNTGTPIIATGLYSNYAINNGVIDTGYSTNTPYSGIDDGCHIYENGVAIALANIATVLDNDCFYYNLGSDGYIYPICYRSNSVKYAVICSNSCERLAVDPYLENGFLSILSTTNEGCLGAIFSLKYTNCLDNYTVLADPNYNCSLPRDVGSGYYKIYVSGCSNSINAAYSNYFFNGDIINTEYTCLTPQCAQDNNLFYIYSSGTSFTPTDGPYSNYYITGNVVDTLYTCIGVGAPQITLDVNKYYEYCEGNAYLVTGCRNDINGFDGSPSGTYCYGSTGEYNPIPCFKLLENGPFTYAYFCDGVPNAQVGIVRFNNLTVCCGMDLGNTEPRCVWIYYCGANCCGSICSGIDPVTLGYGINTNRGFPYEYATGVICQDAEYCYTYSGQIICDSGFISIDNIFYYNLETNTKVQGYFPVCKMAVCSWGCTNLYCDCYCDSYADCYCDLYCDVYNEEDPPVCIGQQCCGSYCYCSYCCGSFFHCSVCCGSYVSTDALCITDICVYINDGTLGCQRCFCQSYCSGTLINEQCSDAYLTAQCDLCFNSLPHQHVYRYSINLTEI